MPKISIIIPVYKTEKYLHKCINSVLNQNFSDYEIILVDDESPDNCPYICDNYSALYNNVKVIHQKNKGLGGARNTGLEFAKGKYVLFLDSDDWIRPFALKILYQKAEDTNADVVLTGETLYLEDKQKFVKGWRNYSWKFRCEKPSDKNFKNCFTPAWGRLYKRDFIENFGLKFIEKACFEDNSWGCFVHLYANKFAFVKNCFFYNRRSDSITNSLGEKVFDWVKDFEYFCNFVEEKNIPKENLKFAYFWYFENFCNYYNKLSDNYKYRFLRLIKSVRDKIDLTINDIEKFNKRDCDLKEFYYLVYEIPIIESINNFNLFGKYKIFTAKYTNSGTDILIGGTIPFLRIK